MKRNTRDVNVLAILFAASLDLKTIEHEMLNIQKENLVFVDL